MSEEVKNEEKNETEAAVSPDLLERIEKTINKIRPYIQADGGDVQLVDYKDGVVTVRMLGACAGCIAIDTTLTQGVQANSGSQGSQDGRARPQRYAGQLFLVLRY